MLFDEHVVVTYGEGDNRLRLSGLLGNPSGEGNNCAIRVVQGILLYLNLSHALLKEKPRKIRIAMHAWLEGKGKSDPEVAEAMANSIVDDEFVRKRKGHSPSPRKILEEALSRIKNGRFLSIHSVIRFLQDHGVFERYSDVILHLYTSTERRRYTCTSNQFTGLSQGNPISIGVHLDGGHFHGIVHESDEREKLREWGASYVAPNIESYHEELVISADEEKPAAKPAPEEDTLANQRRFIAAFKSWVGWLSPSAQAELYGELKRLRSR